MVAHVSQAVHKVALGHGSFLTFPLFSAKYYSTKGYLILIPSYMKNSGKIGPFEATVPRVSFLPHAYNYLPYID